MARHEPATVKLWPPSDWKEGPEPKMFSPTNANDMVRIHGWSRVAPGTPKRKLQNVEIRNVPADGDTMTGRLDALRKEAAALGIRPDLSWGIARLKAEIAKKQVSADVSVADSLAEHERMQTLAAKQKAEDDEEARLMAELEAEAAAKAEQDLANQKDAA